MNFNEQLRELLQDYKRSSFKHPIDQKAQLTAVVRDIHTLIEEAIGKTEGESNGNLFIAAELAGQEIARNTIRAKFNVEEG